MAAHHSLAAHLVEPAVRAALEEDLGLIGDITSRATIGDGMTATAEFRARVDGVIAGLDLVRETFRQVDPALEVVCAVSDGAAVAGGDRVATVRGPARGVLTGERVALNYLGRLSGIATLTRQYVNAVAHTSASIIDTRKTTPGLRALEKYAVRCGGGTNHRIGLFDGVLIKDNHIAVAGGIDAVLARVREHAGHMVKVEIEVDTLDQLAEVMRHTVDAVLLDNMSPETLRKAVDIVGGRCLTEASGGVSLATVAAIAESGVDLISVGALTHSAQVLDIGLDITVGR